MRIGKMYDLVNAFFKLDTNDYVPRYLTRLGWKPETCTALYLLHYSSVIESIIALQLINFWKEWRSVQNWYQVNEVNEYLEIGQYASKVTYFIHYWGQMRVEKIYMTKEPWQHSKIQKQDFYDEVRSNCNSN